VESSRNYWEEDAQELVATHRPIENRRSKAYYDRGSFSLPKLNMKHAVQLQGIIRSTGLENI